jgi:hypothetical protein
LQQAKDPWRGLFALGLFTAGTLTLAIVVPIVSNFALVIVDVVQALFLVNLTEI